MIFYACDLGANLEQLRSLSMQQTRDRMERVGRNRGMDAELRPVADRAKMSGGPQPVLASGNGTCTDVSSVAALIREVSHNVCETPAHVP